MKYKFSTLNSQLSTFNSQLSTLLLVLFFALPLRAQVTIGDNVKPHTFSLLELVVNSKPGGLLLPQLRSSERDGLVSTTSSSADKTAAKGLTIYNTETGCLEFWNGNDWISICSGSSAAQPEEIRGPKFVSLKSTNNVVYSISAVEGATNYTWTFPAGWTVIGGNGNTKTTTNLYITAACDAGATSGVISVSSNNERGSSAPCTLAVTVVDGCGAYIAPSVWKEFMCWNLREDKIYNADPFTPSAEINGDYYQWGGATAIKLSSDPPDVVAGWNDSGPSTWYGSSGTTTVISTVKSDYDPCPDGFRVPNRTEMSGLFANNARNNRGNWNTSVTSECVDCWAGAMIGDVLFLPAAGVRMGDYGDLKARAYFGDYWTSTVLTSPNNFAYFVGFSSGGGGGYDSNTRGSGYSIRCIEE